MNTKLLLTMMLLTPMLLACDGAARNLNGAGAADAQAGHEEDSHAGHESEPHEEDSDHIQLTDAQVKAAGIELAAAGEVRIRETLPLYGVVAPNAERMLEVAARYPGVIRSVTKRIGDPVRRGEVLARVESNESLQTYDVASPLAGVVIDRQANPGEQTRDKPLFTVADLSTVWVELSVFPRDMGKVRLGQRVQVESADTGASAEGRVIYIVPFGQAANQTLTARVLLENPERRWAPGLYVTAEVALAETAVPLAVRNEAIQTVEGRTVVFTRGAGGFEVRPVDLGRSDGRYTEVLSGLEPDESYVTKNSFILKAELGKDQAEHSH